MPPCLKALESGTQLAVRLQPRAARDEVCGLLGTELKIRVTAPPVEGAANAALVEFLSAKLGVSRSRIRIVRGGKSSHKLVQASGLDAATVARRLGLG
jgi:hypothetical protein